MIVSAQAQKLSMAALTAANGQVPLQPLCFAATRFLATGLNAWHHLQRRYAKVSPWQVSNLPNNRDNAVVTG